MHRVQHEVGTRREVHLASVSLIFNLLLFKIEVTGQNSGRFQQSNIPIRNNFYS